jgi:hypothetical protein
MPRHALGVGLSLFASARDRLERFRYIHRGLGVVAGREEFRCVIDLPAHHLYVCAGGSRPLVEQTSFCEYLRAQPEQFRAM